MSVIGRLWRRAPAWRFCLVAATACTGLAAMFPPVLPHLPALWSAKLGVSSYHPHSVARLSETDGLLLGVSQPPPREGSVQFAGRLLPLPVGIWHEIALVRSGGNDVPQIEVLDRVSEPSATGSILTGLLTVEAPAPLSNDVGSVGLPTPCRTIGPNPGHITPTLPTQSPLAHECWVLASVDIAQMRRERQDDPIFRLALARLAELHVAVPPQMLALDYERSDETGWMSTIVLLPSARGLKPTQNWAERFARPMHRGYDHTLVPGDLTPAAVDDPR